MPTLVDVLHGDGATSHDDYTSTATTGSMVEITLTELRNPLGLLQDNTGVVSIYRAASFAPNFNGGV